MISVIIPTYQSPELLDLCLQSAIEGQKNQNQIIVVVDGYYDINKNVLEKYSNHIDILDLTENVGLCRGTNLGVYNAKYEPILIVNDDNVFPMGWDEKLINKYQPGWVFAPNQIEPNPSMFPQFHIKNLGLTSKEFNLKTFQEYEQTLSVDKTEFNGSTLPIFMSKTDYLTVGGWDENYPMGLVSDWDFFLKCNKAGFNMVRTYHTHFYHFASMSVNGEKRQKAEHEAHMWAAYKWGEYIKSCPITNLKYL
jgi:GT2 family glycosyltransferase